MWVGFFSDSRIDLLVLGATLCATAISSLFIGVGPRRSCADDLGFPEDSTTLFRPVWLAAPMMRGSLSLL